MNRGVRQSWSNPGWLLLLGLLSSIWIAAPSSGANKYAGSFMEDGGGARALGMGGAFVAVADDPSTTFWNPAGLATMPGNQLMFMHSERFGDLVDRDFVAYTRQVNWNLLGGQASGLGLSLIRLGVDDIPFTEHINLDSDGNGEVTDEELLALFDRQNEIQFKSDQEWAFLLSYAEQLGRWQLGGSLKFIHQSVGDYSSVGIGMDLALLRPQLWKHLAFGIKFQDLTTTYLSWSTGNNELITPAIIPGLAYDFQIPSWKTYILLASDLETRFDNRRDADQYWIERTSANYHLGLEVGFSERVFLRGGFDSGWEAENMTAGAGFRINLFTVDYAYAGDTLDISEPTHRISVTARF